MQAVYLHCLDSKNEEADVGRVFAITSFPAILGRSAECTLRIGHPLISRRHCSLVLRDQEVWVEDLGSRNGTFLNGEPLAIPQPLQEGDRLTLGLDELTFKVRLADSAGGLTGARVEEAARQVPQNILVVEDSEATAETLAVLLHDWGHRVHVAHDGPQALEAARAHQPDTVFIDLCLPGMDGYQVAERLRAEAGMKEARLVAITGHAQAQVPGRSQEVGFHRTLLKPVAPETLHEVLGQGC